LASEEELPDEEVSFTIHGKIIFAAIVLLYAQAYALNNVTPAILATLLMAYMAFARSNFDEQLAKTTIATRRLLRARTFQDRPLDLHLRIENRSPHGIWVDVSDRVPLELEVASGSPSTTMVIEAGGAGRLSYTVIPRVRGEVTMDAFLMRLKDERGMMSVDVEGRSPLRILVEPSLESIRGGEVLLRRRYALRAGTSPSNKLGRGYEFGGLRRYVPEDPSTLIEWKASSRLAKLMTKLLYEEIQSSVYIFLDCSRSMRLSRSARQPSKLDQSVRIAVQLATGLSRSGYPVGIGLFDEHRVIEFEPPRTKQKPSSLFSPLSAAPGSKVVDRASSGTMAASAAEIGEDQGMGFLSRILPFLGRRSVPTTERAAGIYAAVERMIIQKAKSTLVMIFTDLESNPSSFVLSCKILVKRGHRPIIVTPFSPAFELRKEDLDVQTLERLYVSYQRKRTTIKELEKMGIDVVEIGSDKRDAVQVSRRISRR